MRMNMVLAAIALAVVSSAPPAEAQTASGTMRCNVKGAFGYLIASDHAVTCTYRRPGAPVEFYTGSTGNLGFDLGPTNAFVATYQVSAAPLMRGVLQGDFVGPGFGIAGGPGSSSNSLIGPGGVTLFRIPNSDTTAFTGVTLSVGLNRLHLQYVDVDQIADRRRSRHLLRSYGISEAD